jgi:hypothetical protein
MMMKKIYGYPDVFKATPFDLQHFELVKGNILVLYSLQQKGCQTSLKILIFHDPSHIERPG